MPFPKIPIRFFAFFRGARARRGAVPLRSDLRPFNCAVGLSVPLVRGERLGVPFVALYYLPVKFKR